MASTDRGALAKQTQTPIEPFLESLSNIDLNLRAAKLKLLAARDLFCTATSTPTGDGGVPNYDLVNAHLDGIGTEFSDACVALSAARRELSGYVHHTDSSNVSLFQPKQVNSGCPMSLLERTITLDDSYDNEEDESAIAVQVYECDNILLDASPSEMASVLNFSFNIRRL
jgi:hypothetical protein